MSVIVANNPHVSFPISPFGFIDDNFEPGTLNARWKTRTDITPVPTLSIVDNDSQKSARIAHPSGTRYDINQSGVFEGLLAYQDVAAATDFDIIACVEYPDATFSSTNSQYIGVGIMFYYDGTNYVWLEAQQHPTTGARLRYGRDDATSGQTSGTNSSPGFTFGVNPIYLRLKRIGNAFEFYASPNDIDYYFLVSYTCANLGTNGNKLGFFGEDYHATEASTVAWNAHVREIRNTYLGFISDTFEQGESLAPHWNELDNVGDATFSLVSGQAKIALPNASKHDMYAGNPIEAAILYQNVRSHVDFELIVEIDPCPDGADTDVNNDRWAAGIVFRLDDTNWYAFEVMARDTGATSVFERWDDDTSGGSGQFINPAVGLPLAGPVWLRMVRVSTTFSAYISDDGVTWETLTASRTLTALGSGDAASKLGCYALAWHSVEANILASNQYFSEIKAIQL